MTLYRKNSKLLVHANGHLKIPSGGTPSLVVHWYSNYPMYVLFDSTIWLAQTFIAPKNFTLTSVKLNLYVPEANSTDIEVSIFAVDANHFPTGSALATTVIPSSNIPNYATSWCETNAISLSLVNGVEYAIVAHQAADNGIRWNIGYPTDINVLWQYSYKWTFWDAGSGTCLFESWGY
jgi:hypothetical protein